jgi:flagellar hook-basal body complex protein FliE
MSLIGSVSSIFQNQTPGGVDLSKLTKVAPNELPGLDATMAPTAPQTPSFGAILDNVVGEVNTKMEAGNADQAKLLSGESTNLHQAMISVQEASVAFSLMVEVRNKMVDSYQELMRMQM